MDLAWPGSGVSGWVTPLKSVYFLCICVPLEGFRAGYGALAEDPGEASGDNGKETPSGQSRGKCRWVIQMQLPWQDVRPSDSGPFDYSLSLEGAG